MEHSNKSSNISPEKSTDPHTANHQRKEPEKVPHHNQPVSRKEEESSPQPPTPDTSHPASPPNRTMQQNNGNAPAESIGANAPIVNPEPDEPGKALNASQLESRKQEPPFEAPATENNIETLQRTNNNESSISTAEKSISTSIGASHANQEAEQLPQSYSRKRLPSPETPAADNSNSHDNNNNSRTMEHYSNNNNPSVVSMDTVVPISAQEPEEPEMAPHNPNDANDRNQGESIPETSSEDDGPRTPPQAPLVLENPPKRHRMNPMRSALVGDEYVLPPSLSP